MTYQNSFKQMNSDTMVFDSTLNGMFKMAENLENNGDRPCGISAKNVCHSSAKELISLHEELQSLSHDTNLYHKEKRDAFLFHLM